MSSNTPVRIAKEVFRLYRSLRRQAALYLVAHRRYKLRMEPDALPVPFSFRRAVSASYGELEGR